MRALGLGLLVLSCGVVGCGPDIDSYCEKEVQCLGGNDKDIDACVAIYDVSGDFYSDLGCSDEFDAYFECITPLAQCNENPTGKSCTTNDDCNNNQKCSMSVCVSVSFDVESADRDKCQKEAAAFTSCGQF